MSASAAYLFGAGRWEEMVIAAAVASLLLLVVYANGHWVYGHAIGVAIIIAALWAETASWQALPGVQVRTGMVPAPVLFSHRTQSVGQPGARVRGVDDVVNLEGHA